MEGIEVAEDANMSKVKGEDLVKMIDNVPTTFAFIFEGVLLNAGKEKHTICTLKI